MPTINANSSVTVAIAVGDVLRVSGGYGTAQITPPVPQGLPRDLVPLTLTGATFGPYPAAVSVALVATSALTYRLDSRAARSEVDAGDFGVLANGQDMTVALTAALNATLEDGKVLRLPRGTVRFAGPILVTASTSTPVASYAGAVQTITPVGIVGYGDTESILLNTIPGTNHITYRPGGGVINSPTFRDFQLRHQTPSLTNVYQAGIELGGGAVDCVTGNLQISNVSGYGLYAVFRVDDCTSATVSGLLNESIFRYYMEAGYNADGIGFTGFNGSCIPRPVDVACTSSTGTTITGIAAAVVSAIFVGEQISGAGVTPGTRVTGKPTATSITVDTAVTAVTQFDCHMGVWLSMLNSNNGGNYSGSGYATVANAQNYVNRGRPSNANVVKVDGRSVQARGEALIEDYAGTYGCVIEDFYTERPAKIATFSGAAWKGNVIQRVFVSQPQSLRQPAIVINVAQPRGVIRDIETDGTTNSAVTISAPSMTSNGEFGAFTVSNLAFGAVSSGAGPSMSAAGRTIVYGSSENGNGVWQYSTAGGDANFDALGIDIIEVTLERNGRTIIGPNSVQIPAYRRLRFVFVQDATGGRTISLDARYVKPDGTTWGLLSSGTANQRATLDFFFTGTKYVSAQSVLGWS